MHVGDKIKLLLSPFHAGTLDAMDPRGARDGAEVAQAFLTALGATSFSDIRVREERSQYFLNDTMKTTDILTRLMKALEITFVSALILETEPKQLKSP